MRNLYFPFIWMSWENFLLLVLFNRKQSMQFQLLLSIHSRRQWTGLNRKGTSMCHVHVGIAEVHSLKTIWILLLFSESTQQLCTALRVCSALLIGAEIIFFIHVILSSPLCYPLKGSHPWGSLGTGLYSWMSTVLPNTRNSNKNNRVP